jgi:parallel beta-helix repeat protein
MMQTHFHRARLAAALIVLAALPVAAQAAQGYDSCAGFIDALPATITTQGTWCLRKDLATAMTAGAAITIAANNVTIDCNHFKFGGLAAGDGSTASGVHSAGRSNATVRNCTVRGFYTGIRLEGGGGHLVEDNRVDESLEYGIVVEGDSGTVRRNQVLSTGGGTGRAWPIGIQASADILDNLVDGMFGNAALPYAYPMGILATRGGVEVRGNRVRGLIPGTGYITGIRPDMDSHGVIFSDNSVTAAAPTPGYGLIGGTAGICTRNIVSRVGANGVGYGIGACQDAGGNASN